MTRTTTIIIAALATAVAGGGPKEVIAGRQVVKAVHPLEVDLPGPDLSAGGLCFDAHGSQLLETQAEDPSFESPPGPEPDQ